MTSAVILLGCRISQRLQERRVWRIERTFSTLPSISRHGWLNAEGLLPSPTIDCIGAVP